MYLNKYSLMPNQNIRRDAESANSHYTAARIAPPCNCEIDIDILCRGENAKLGDEPVDDGRWVRRHEKLARLSVSLFKVSHGCNLHLTRLLDTHQLTKQIVSFV